MRITKVALALNDLANCEIIFHRMALTVYPELAVQHESKYTKFDSGKCYYVACMGILKHKDPTNKIIILGGYGVPQHAILTDRNNRILEDSYARMRTSWEYPVYKNLASARGKTYEDSKEVVGDIQAKDLINWIKL
jgi:hypothetical protein